MKQNVLVVALCVSAMMLHGADEELLAGEVPPSSVEDNQPLAQYVPQMQEDESPETPAPAAPEKPAERVESESEPKPVPVSNPVPTPAPIPAPTPTVVTRRDDAGWTGEMTKGITNSAEKHGRTNYVIRNKLLKRALELTATVRELLGALDKHFEDLQAQARVALEKVATFRSDNGLALGKVEGTIQTLTSQVESARAVGQLSEQERKVQKDLETQLQEIEQLKKQRDLFVELAGLIDQMVKRLVEQVNRGRQLGIQAEELNDKISNEFSDRAAQRMCDEMDAAIANIKQIDGYITNDLRKFLGEVRQQIEKQTDVITAAIEQLRKNGIDLTKEVQDADRSDEARRLAKAKDSCKTPKAEPVSWLDSIADWAATAWEYIKAPFVFVYNWVMQWFEGTPSQPSKSSKVAKKEAKVEGKQESQVMKPEVVAATPPIQLPAISMPTLPAAPAEPSAVATAAAVPEQQKQTGEEKSALLAKEAPESASSAQSIAAEKAVEQPMAEVAVEPTSVESEATEDATMAEAVK